jgi:protein-S-isoprenylcysteine O-methyltransferase Ste14
MSGKGVWYVVVQAVLMLAALLAPVFGARSGSWPSAVVALGSLLAVAGVGIAAAASIALGRRSLSPLPKPRPGATLVQHGVFTLVRHPIYTGLTLFVLGWGLAWSSLLTVAGALVLLAFFDVKARREEHWLAAKFPDYAAYSQRVNKLIPFIY